MKNQHLQNAAVPKKVKSLAEFTKKLIWGEYPIAAHIFYAH